MEQELLQTTTAEVSDITQQPSKLQKRREYQRNYYHERVNKESERERKKLYYHEHKDKILEKMRIKYSGNKIQQQLDKIDANMPIEQPINIDHSIQLE